MPQRFIPKLIDLYRAGQFPFDRLVKFYGFSEINKAIADANCRDTVKRVLRINGGEGEGKQENFIFWGTLTGTSGGIHGAQ